MVRLYETFEQNFRSGMDETQNAIADILAFISDSSGAAVSSYILDDLKLIYSELLFNAAIHGNKLDCGKHVHVRVEIAGDDVISIVRDEGEGFDTASFIKKVTNEQNLSGEHGRGVRLVMSMTDELSFNERGNEIRFRKRLVGK